MNSSYLMTKSTLALALVTSALFCVTGTPAYAGSSKPEVVGYYEAYSGPAKIASVPWAALTRLNIAFIGIDNTGRATWMVADGKNRADTSGVPTATVRALVAARNQHNPNVKLLLSVGGASMSNRFSAATRDAASRQKLASMAVAVANTLGLDGVDYDWEYPGRLGQKNCEQGPGACQSPDDYKNLTKLLQQTRALLSAEQLLTVAVYVDPSAKGVPYDVPGMDAQLDAWNVMAYDIAAPDWVPATAFPAGIEASTRSLDAFVKLGASPKKLVLGVPFYSYIWRQVPWGGVDVTPTASASAGAGQQHSIAALFGRYGSDPGCKLFETPDGDFYYCDAGPLQGEWCPVDSVRVLQQKGHFVRDNGFAGLMSWSVALDTSTQLMANTMAKSLQ